MYTEKVIEHFRNPKNMGKMPDADSMAQVGNPVCGDIMKIYIKVKDDKIKDIKFQTLGCGAAIAVSSMLTTLVKGKRLEEAKKITRDDVAEALGGLPSVKMHCSVLAIDALKKAIKNYKEKSKK